MSAWSQTRPRWSRSAAMDVRFAPKAGLRKLASTCPFRAGSGSVDTSSALSQRATLTVQDPHPGPVELSHGEAFEPLVVGAAIVSQQPERLLFADEQAADAIGAVMHAGGVAAKRDVVGQLVDLVAEGEIGALPGVQRRAVWSGLDGVRQHVIRVKEGFKDRGAGACIAGVSRGIGRVRGTSLREGDGQQACSLL